AKRDAEIRAEERGEDREPPLRRHRAGRSDAEATSKDADERKKCERADESSALHQRDALGLERFAPLFISTRFALIGPLRALLGTLAPLAAPSTSCHETEATARRALRPVRGPYPLGLRSLALGVSSSSVCAGSSCSLSVSSVSASARSTGRSVAGRSSVSPTSGDSVSD